MSAEFSHGILNPLWLRNHMWACVHLHAQTHTVCLAPLQVEIAAVCLWGGVPMAGMPKIFLILFTSEKL